MEMEDGPALYRLGSNLRAWTAAEAALATAQTLLGTCAAWIGRRHLLRQGPPSGGIRVIRNRR